MRALMTMTAQLRLALAVVAATAALPTWLCVFFHVCVIWAAAAVVGVAVLLVFLAAAD